jgi:DNA end-binding protein Ku
MARPYWSGHIQISLVSFGVELYTATESKSQISLRELDVRTGQRIHHRNVNESEEEVDRSNIVKGYEHSKGEYVVIEPEELKQLRIPSKKTIQITKFVDPEAIDYSYFEKPYFVMPEDELQGQTYAVIREAMVETNRAGLGEISFSGRENLIVLMPYGGKDGHGMMIYVLRYAEELRDAGKMFSEIKESKIEPDQLDLAKELIRRNTAKFSPADFKDDYEAALREFIDAKLNHRELPREEEPRRGKVIPLTEALRQSLAEKKPAAAEKKPPKSAATGGKTAAKKLPSGTARSNGRKATGQKTGTRG